MFQQHQGESLSQSWTRFKYFLRKVPHHGIDIWLLVQIFYDHIDHTLKRTVDHVAEGRLRKMSAEKAWATIEELARYEDEGWNDPVFPEEESLDYRNPNIEQLLGVMECKVMEAPVISISSDSSDESVGSSIPRVILIGSIPIEVLVAPEVGAAAVASPTRVLELDTHSSSESGPSESTLPSVPVAPMVSPFICLDDSESDTKLPERHVSSTPHDAMIARWRSRVASRPSSPSRSSSPTTSTSEIPTAPIPPAPPTIDIPVSRLYRTHPGGPYHFTSGSSSDHSSSDHSSADHSPADHTSGHSTSDQFLSRHSSPSLPLGMRPRHSHLPSHSAGPSRKRCRSPATTVPSYIPASGALVPTRADLLLPRKRFRDSISPEDSIEEDIDADVLADIEADAAAVEVAADMDVEVGVDVGIGIEVGDDIEDEAEPSDRGTMEVGVDVIARINIPDGMLMPDAVECLEQVKEVVQGIYGHVMEIPLQRVEDIKTGQIQLEVKSLIASGERAGLLDHVAALERSNARLRGTLMMESAIADRLHRCMGFMEDELRQIHRFRYYDRLRFRRLEAFTARRLGFRS
ncbi:hypothetical protein Tco_0013491 [Tanacetum coccineum]